MSIFEPLPEKEENIIQLIIRQLSQELNIESSVDRFKIVKAIRQAVHTIILAGKDSIYEARFLEKPNDPINSEWRAVLDEDGNPVVTENYNDCLQEALNCTEGEDRSGLVIAKLSVNYIIPHLAPKSNPIKALVRSAKRRAKRM